MRWTRWIAFGSTALAAVAAIGSLSCSTTSRQESSTTTTMTAEQKVERGKYLTTVIPCGDCHTPGTLYGAADETRKFSGSEMGWAGPWGVVYARNLTPDSTGLAAWTEEQIVTVIRTGNRPDGRQLASVMPWMSFAALSDEDAGAIAAYLKSLPPVAHKVPEPVPPTAKAAGSILVFPPPPAWDAMNLPPPPGTPKP